MANCAAGRRWWRLVATPICGAAWLLATTSPVLACACDCNADCEVTVDELVTAVDIALGNASPSICPRADSNSDASTDINDLIVCVQSALLGCAPGSCEYASRCGNGVRDDAIEECDDGGRCLGGANAGAACTAERDCSGGGLCTSGSLVGRWCDSDTDCEGAPCRRCVPGGGDGCAANCRQETDLTIPLAPGLVVGSDVASATSGVVLNGDVLTLPLPLSGEVTLTVGKPGADGRTPLVIRAASVRLERVNVPTLLDACVRFVGLQTCGGSLFEADGSASPSCTAGFAGAVNCPPQRPCASPYGPGNAAQGILGCGAEGLSGVNLLAMRNQAGGLSLAYSGTGPPGSATALVTLAVGFVESDGCTDADPVSTRGTPFTVPVTTGTARDAVLGGGTRVTTTSGSPLDCSALAANQPQVVQFGLAGVLPTLSEPTVGDTTAVVQLFAAGSPPGVRQDP